MVKFDMLPGNHNSAGVLPETASTHHMQMFQPPDSASDEMLDQVEEASVEEKENGPKKKRQLAKAPKSPKAKKGTRAPRAPKPEDSPSVQQGRKMSSGAFKKVLEKVAGEGCDFSNPIDLRTHWAKHGTNKFVTIRVFKCSL
ncbi:hypothetical protein DKX38_018401 [Salix brachista]|uniref:GAGA-binding transcriptional activator n=1 Tax=Salix brachista TaxID=2182728 RepID=A0A5N5KN19_9ROSI|nr:hypothetical protein DKX38_018401 [Salix brachista]